MPGFKVAFRYKLPRVATTENRANTLLTFTEIFSMRARLIRGVSSCHRTYWYRADFECPHFCDINFGLITNFGEPLSIILPSPSCSLLRKEKGGRGEDD